jgi:ADP-heptose:LPS heptosyltransferase
MTHVAAALGVPTVAVFGPTDPHVWRPLGAHVRVAAPPEPGPIESVSVEDVLPAAGEYLRIR